MPIGITITTSESPQPVGAGESTGTLFLVGTTSSGPTGVTKCLSLNDWVTAYGARDTTGATSYDSVETFFREGGEQLYFASVGVSGVDSDFVTKLALFTPDFGPGQVAIPGRSSNTIRDGVSAHAASTSNRVGIFRVGASGSAASLVAALGTATNADYLIPVAGDCTIPGVTPGTTRTVPPEAVVGALCAQVASTGNDNQWPAGRKWPLRFVTGFTAAYTAASLPSAQSFTKSDLDTLNAAGINVFAIRSGILCLFGFVTAKLQTQDLIYWSASAARERMALVHETRDIADPYLFDTLDGQGVTITAFAGDLQKLIADHWRAGALFGETALEAGSVNVASPVNTPATEQAGQLNAVLNVRISPVDETVALQIQAAPITQSV